MDVMDEEESVITKLLDENVSLRIENKDLKNENQILKEDLTTLEEETTRLYNIMQGSKISREQDIEEI